MKIQKFGLLIAIATGLAFASQAKAQLQPGDQPLDPYVFLPEQFYMALPPLVSDWQETTDLAVCQRTRTVTDQGCWFDDFPDGAQYFCDDPDHGVADTQVGVYVPGVGCTQWTSTSYTLVSGDGSQFGTLQDQ